MSKPGSRSVIIIAAIALFAALVSVFLAFTAGSQAAFPGANGKILYEGDRTLYIMDADGSNLSELTDGARPAWSADGTKVAFQRGYDIWVMDADGANQVNITNSESTDDNPAWAPDGQHIAFERSRSPDPGVWLMREDGSDQMRLISSVELRKVLDGGISWSPDGRKIVSGGTEIFVADVDGTGVVQLTDDGSLTDSAPAWSSDGSYIAWNSADGKTHDIWVMDANGDNRVNLTDDAAVEWGLDWSPDGTKIVFASRRSGNALGGSLEIHVMNADGTCPTRISTQSGSHPAWQPIPDSAEVSPPLTCASSSPSPTSTETPSELPPTGGQGGGESFTGIAVGASMLALGVAAILFVARKTRAT